MPGLLLAPYNDSMSLGQGYNSFLQSTRMLDAMVFPRESTSVEPTKGSSGVPQVVSYSSRFVDKISDLTRSMNISAGSSIKNGSVVVSGNSNGVDESKFASSDLNAVVSVKVVNQSKGISATPKFTELQNLTKEKFRAIYGDCYISGFITGGDLHGIVSVNVLETSQVSKVKNKIKQRFNTGSDAENEIFHLGNAGSSGSSGSASSLKSQMSQSETTISVNWSGGGEIKQPKEEWSLELLFKVAAMFPSNVAKCPQRTWAILTPYRNNISFLISGCADLVADYTGVENYAADLLDIYMEHKNNLTTIQHVLGNLDAYDTATKVDTDKAVPVNAPALVAVRSVIKKQMTRISAEVDKLNEEPERVTEYMETFMYSKDIPLNGASSADTPLPAYVQRCTPEEWATRLPVIKRKSESELAEKEMAEFKNLLQGFNMAKQIEPEVQITPNSPLTYDMWHSDARKRTDEFAKSANFGLSGCQWIILPSDVIPVSAIVSGHYPGKTDILMYHCRTFHDGSLALGRVYLNSGGKLAATVVDARGKDVPITNGVFEILVGDPSRYEWKQILDSTDGSLQEILSSKRAISGGLEGNMPKGNAYYIAKGAIAVDKSKPSETTILPAKLTDAEESATVPWLGIKGMYTTAFDILCTQAPIGMN